MGDGAPGSAQRTQTRPQGALIRGGRISLANGDPIVIGAEPITIGRAESNTLCIDDPQVSALHCELRASSGGVELRDLGSRNGTFVGVARISRAVLTGPCNVQVGDATFRFELGEPEAGPSSQASRLGQLVGRSPSCGQLYRLISLVAPTELSALVCGETGSGKELVAREIHRHSARAEKPFVVVDCAALPESLAESLLFGHTKGSFTGAASTTPGAFREAHGGTLFLDELGELPASIQPKLLRAVAERTVKRVGGAAYDEVDVRFIAATRRDLRAEVNSGAFREDLYFRLAQARIEVPSLRSRVEDIPLLVDEVCQRLGRNETAPSVTGFLQNRFRGYDWPGNVRELVNVASVLASIGDGHPDIEQMLPTEKARGESSNSDPDLSSGERFVQAKRSFEERYFRSLLAETEGNISEISRRCGLARHQVRAHLKKLGLA